jgi:predicted GIY-YIG superfamily endonuclease
VLLRDRLLARMAELGSASDAQRLAEEVLGIRNAPPELARKLIAQALVVEDRLEDWLRIGERVCAAAPPSPGVYILREAGGRALYVGKANNVRRRLRTHFARRRWRALKAPFVRAADAEWLEVGSELEALVREAEWIARENPVANVQIGEPQLATRAIPAALVRDTIVLAPSVEADSVELVAARSAGAVQIQRTRRNGADLLVHTRRLWRFFKGVDTGRQAAGAVGALAPIVFSWLAHRGAEATRLDPHDAAAPRDLEERLRAALAHERLFTERVVVLNSKFRSSSRARSGAPRRKSTSTRP